MFWKLPCEVREENDIIMVHLWRKKPSSAKMNDFFKNRRARVEARLTLFLVIYDHLCVKPHLALSHKNINDMQTLIHLSIYRTRSICQPLEDVSGIQKWAIVCSHGVPTHLNCTLSLKKLFMKKDNVIPTSSVIHHYWLYFVHKGI